MTPFEPNVLSGAVERRVLVCGSRNWTNYSVVYIALDARLPYVLLHGDCRGADRMAEQVARAHKMPFQPWPADWTLGLQAGPIRNRRMLNEGKPDVVLAFHDNLRKSKGTKDMVMIARYAGVPVFLINSNGVEVLLPPFEKP